MRFNDTVRSVCMTLAFVVMIMPGLSFASGLHLGYRGYSGHQNYYGHGYRSYGYGYRNYNRHYGYRRGYDYRNNYRNYNSAYTQNTAATTGKTILTTPTTQTTPYEGADSPAWAMLSAGQKETALSTFATEAQSHPREGIPKVGYAMAYASLGNLEKGIWAMRRAFRIAPESLHYLNFDIKGSLLADELIKRYKDNLGQTNQNKDAAFMIASLSYLKHDYKMANKYIKIALAEGSQTESLINLQRLTEQQLSGNN